MFVVTHVIDEHTSCNLLLNSSSYISLISIMCKCLKKYISLKWLFNLTMGVIHMRIACLSFCTDEQMWLPLSPRFFNLQLNWLDWTIYLFSFIIEIHSPLSTVLKGIFAEPLSFNGY